MNTPGGKVAAATLGIGGGVVAACYLDAARKTALPKVFCQVTLDNRKRGDYPLPACTTAPGTRAQLRRGARRFPSPGGRDLKTRALALQHSSRGNPAAAH